MKAVRFYGIRDIRVDEVSMPEIGPDDVLVKVAYAGICGSDMHIYNKGMFVENIPEIMGHEFSGVIVRVGDNVSGIKTGDKVVGDPTVTCGLCHSCKASNYNTCDSLGFIGEVRPGCFAEYISLPQDKVVPLPEGADLKRFALAEPLAVAINALEIAGPAPEDRLAVIGAGPIGILICLVAKNLFGVKDITLINRSAGRLAEARSAGIENTCTECSDHFSFDKVFETAGNDKALNMAAGLIKSDGIIYVVSIYEGDNSSAFNTIVSKQLLIKGCNAYTRRHIEMAVDAISGGKIDVFPLISKEFKIDHCNDAFVLNGSKGRSAVKMLLNINGEEE